MTRRTLWQSFHRDSLGGLIGFIDTTREASPLQDDGEGRLFWTSAGGAQRFEYRASGGDWVSVPIQIGYGVSTISLRDLASGVYDYRLTQTEASGAVQEFTGQLRLEAGQPARRIDAHNLPRITGLSVRPSTIGGQTGSDDAAAWLVFTDPGAGYTAQFQYRADSASAWSTLPLVARGNGLVGVNRSAIPAGRYDYQLLLTVPGEAAPSRTIAGQADLPPYAPSGERAMAVSANGAIAGARPARVLRLPLPPAGTQVQLRLRPVEAEAETGVSDWQSLPLQTEVMGVDAKGQRVGYQKLDLASLPTGRYEVELRWLREGQPIAQSRGLLDLTRADGEAYADQTPDYLPAYTLAATAPRISLTSDQWLRPEIRQAVDRWGNVLAVNDVRSLAWITTARYNADNRVIEQAGPQVTLATGETVRPVTRFQYDLLGRQIGMQDANGNQTRWRFDAAGQLHTELHADGGIVTHAYDAFGNRVATTDARGVLHTMRYDALDRRLETRIAGELVHRAHYDEAGRMLASANGAGETTHYRYDLRGNLVAVIAPMGQRTAYAYDAHNRLIRSWRDGQLVQRREYDAAGRLILEDGGTVGEDTVKSLNSALPEADRLPERRSIYRYDANGRLTYLQTDERLAFARPARSQRALLHPVISMATAMNQITDRPTQQP